MSLHSTIRPFQAAFKNLLRPNVLYAGDWDASTHEDGNQAGCDETGRVLEKHGVKSAVITGRGETMAHALAEPAAGLPLDAVSTNNGLGVYHRPAGLTTKEFLQHITPGDASTGWDAAWQKHVEDLTHGFSIPKLRTMMLDELKDQGFTPAPNLPAPRDSFTCLQKTIDGQEVLVAVPPDQPGYQVRCPNGPITNVHRDFGEWLQQKTSAALDKQGTTHTHYTLLEGGSEKTGKPHDRYTHQFTPDAITKAEVTDYLAKYYRAHYVIPVGDAGNDKHIEMTQAGPQGAKVFPVLAGDHHPNPEVVKQNPNWVEGVSGAVGPAVETQWQAIRQDMRQYPLQHFSSRVSQLATDVKGLVFGH